MGLGWSCREGLAGLGDLAWIGDRARQGVRGLGHTCSYIKTCIGIG